MSQKIVRVRVTDEPIYKSWNADNIEDAVAARNQAVIDKYGEGL